MTLFTSVTKINTKKANHLALIYCIYTIIVAVFSAIYETKSHDVYSHYMMYPFMFPLCMGIFPNALIGSFKRDVHINTISYNLWNATISTAVCGSIFEGILIIFGTTNQLDIYFLYATCATLAGSVLFFIIGLIISFIKGGKK